MLLLRAVEVPGPAAEVLRGEPRLHPAGEPPQRDRQPASQSGLQDVNITRTGRDLGHPRAVRRGVHDLRLVRRPAELHHRHRLRHRRRASSASGGRPTCTSSARTSRASTAPCGRRCCWPPGMEPPRLVFGHGFVYMQERGDRRGREDQQVARQRRRADGHHHEVQRRGVPLLLPARVPVPRRRRVQLAAVRRRLQRRPGQQPRQPLQPGGDADHQELRRRPAGHGRPGRRRRSTRDEPGGDGASRSAATSRRASTTRRWRRSGGRSSTRPTSTPRNTHRGSWSRPTRTRPQQVLFDLRRAAAGGAILLKPFLPRSAETIYRASTSRRRGRRCATRTRPAPAAQTEDLRVLAALDGGKVKPLFPRIG